MLHKTLRSKPRTQLPAGNPGGTTVAFPYTGVTTLPGITTFPGKRAAWNIAKTLPGVLIAWWDGVAERIYGYTAREVVGKPGSILFPANRLDELSWIMERIEKGKGIDAYETVRKRKDGKPIRVSLSISPVHDGGGRVIGAATKVREAGGQPSLPSESGNGHGCTALLEPENGLEYRGEGSLQEEEMEALGRLANGVAHDFNNVLGVMLGYAQLMQRASTEEKRQANLAQIFRAGNQAKLLTRQLQAFGHQQTAEIRVMDLGEEIGHLSEMLRLEMQPKIELTTDLEPGPCRIQADPSLIDQVMIELAANAREAMPEGGRLMIASSIVGHQSVPDLLPPGGYVRLSVSDTGRGMNAKERAHIFEPFFFTGEKKGNKNGLRLATVYGMVKQNGGYIFVDSKPQCGTTFRMYFPQAE